MSISLWHLGHDISPFLLFLKSCLRFIILVVSSNIIEASDRVSDLIYCSLFGSFLYLRLLIWIN